MKEKEIWKEIEGYEGLYFVSNLGRIKRSFFQSQKSSADKEIMQPSESKGYLVVGLNKFSGTRTKSEVTTFGVHRLVALAFVHNDDIARKTQPNHKDRNKKNNHASNLEWVTPTDNILHSWCNPKRKRSNRVIWKFSKLNKPFLAS